MEVVYLSNEFPGEDLQNLFRHLQVQSEDREHVFMATFLHEATLALKDEIRQLPFDLRQQIPPFETVLAWAENNELRTGPLCGAVDGVLLVTVQLASYIGYLERGRISIKDNMEILALGVGLLSSTAIALSPTIAELPRAAVDAVRLAFRMGIHVQGVSENLDVREETPDTWAYVVHNVDPQAAQEELDFLQANQQSIPETGKIFISAVSKTSVTISGPPSRLKTLFNTCEFFRDAQSIALPVFGGLCHAPHVYHETDTKQIVHGANLNTLTYDVAPCMPVYSTSTGKPYPVKTAEALYSAVVTELLTQAIRWEDVVDSIVEKAEQTSPASIRISCFGNSLPLKELKTALNPIVSDPSACTVELITAWVTKTKPHIGPRGSAASKLAIVGMSCRLPGGATSNDKFWEILEQGLDVSREVPIDRFDLETHYDPEGKDMNKSATRYGCFIDEPGLFDAPFFNMSPKEAQTVDPQMRLALVTAYEALEQSGYSPGRFSTESERVGTFYGQAADDYREVNQGQEVSTYYIPGGCRAFGPGRINYFFKFSGPSYSIDTACSSGLAAVEVACQALWSGSVDTAITGGVNVLTNPDGFSGLAHGHFLTKGHNACKTWDAEADGYCRADGVVSFVIKRLQDAEANNDTILATILGAGTNHSANAVSITHPHAGHQAYLARQVLRKTGVDPLDVDYIELHGTGTQAGDYEEMAGIHEVYAPAKGRRRTKKQPLHIGSVKANVGHGESVAGATSLLKVLLLLQKNKIPPHVGIKTKINPRLDYESFEKRNLHIDFEVTDWPKIEGKQRLAVVNSFGAAGGNTTIVIEEAAERVIAVPDSRPSPIVAVSAKTKKSLTQSLHNLVEYLENHPETSLADLGYTTTARRYHHNHRIAIAATDIDQLKKQLTSRIEKVDNIKSIASISSNPPPIAFAFTGQGASNKSMSLELYRDCESFQQNILDLDRMAQAQGFPSFIPALDGSYEKDFEHPPVVTQLALTCTEIALARYWQTLGIRPDVVIGHSLGEYAALHIAGVLTASDAVFAVGRRAQMLQEKCQMRSHTMMAVRATRDDIAAKSEGKPYTIACVNGPSDTVLSGTKEQMDDIAQPLESAGFRCFKLDVPFAFHSEQVDPILDEYEAMLEAGVQFQEPKLPVISPLLGKVVFDDKTLNANYLRTATRESVDFLSALQHAQKISTLAEDTVYIEIGPHPTCVNFVKSCLPSTALALPSIKRGESNWKILADSLSALHLHGLTVRWDEFHRPFESSLRVLNDLPSYAFNDKNHWLPYTGTWCLTKGNDFYDVGETAGSASMPTAVNDVQTSTVQRIIEESFDGAGATVVMRSDLMQPDFLAAANGHRMNDCGVVTSSIHADIAYTLGEHIYKKLVPGTKGLPSMNMSNLVVTKGLVANTNPHVPQVLQVTAETSDYQEGVDLTWHNIDEDGNAAEESFATAKLTFGKASEWLTSWKPMAHLIHTRIEALERMANEGKASRFSHSMAYGLFANNLVDYAEKYRGMQSVVMNELEGFADIQLTQKESGTWTVPPYFIDSVAHLAGFIMNCSDAMDTRNNFCVTPGWQSMRFAKPLGPGGARYRSYVKMIPTEEDPSIFMGDVYIMQDNVIVGFVGGITFRKYPRALINRFFAPPPKDAAPASKKSEKAVSKPKLSTPKKAAKEDAPKSPAAKKEEKSAASPKATTPPRTPDTASEFGDSDGASTPPESEGPPTPKSEPAAPVMDKDSTSGKAMQLIADECGCERAEMEDDMSFADLGVDSLMSLVVSEKLRTLDVTVSGSLFLEYPTIGDLRKWLDEAYG